MKATRKVVTTGTGPQFDSAHKRSRSVGGVKLLNILKDDDNLSAAGDIDNAAKRRKKSGTFAKPCSTSQQGCSSTNNATSSNSCKSCDECRKLKVLLSEREKQLHLQQQQLKVSDSMAEEVHALAKRCKIYEQKARRLSTSTMSIATKQMGTQAMSLATASLDSNASASGHRRTSSRLCRKNLEEKIDKLEAKYALQSPEDKENSPTSQQLLHRRSESNISFNLPTKLDNGSESEFDALSVKNRILKRKLNNNTSASTTNPAPTSTSTLLPPTSTTAALVSAPNPAPTLALPSSTTADLTPTLSRSASNSSTYIPRRVHIAWVDVKSHDNVMDLEPPLASQSIDPYHPQPSQHHQLGHALSVKDYMCPEASADSLSPGLLPLHDDDDNDNLVRNIQQEDTIIKAPKENYSDSKKENQPTTITASSSSSLNLTMAENYELTKAQLLPTPVSVSSKSVRSRLLDVLADMDCKEEERFEKLQLLFEIRSLQQGKK